MTEKPRQTETVSDTSFMTDKTEDPIFEYNIKERTKEIPEKDCESDMTEINENMFETEITESLGSIHDSDIKEIVSEIDEIQIVFVNTEDNSTAEEILGNIGEVIENSKLDIKENVNESKELNVTEYRKGSIKRKIESDIVESTSEIQEKRFTENIEEIVENNEFDVTKAMVRDKEANGESEHTEGTMENKIEADMLDKFETKEKTGSVIESNSELLISLDIIGVKENIKESEVSIRSEDLSKNIAVIKKQSTDFENTENFRNKIDDVNILNIIENKTEDERDVKEAKEDLDGNFIDADKEDVEDILIEASKENVEDNVTETDVEDIIIEGDKEDVEDIVIEADEEYVEDSVIEANQEYVEDYVIEANKEYVEDIIIEANQEYVEDNVIEADKEDMEDINIVTNKEDVEDIDIEADEEDVEDSFIEDDKEAVEDICIVTDKADVDNVIVADKDYVEDNAIEAHKEAVEDIMADKADVEDIVIHSDKEDAEDIVKKADKEDLKDIALETYNNDIENDIIKTDKEIEEDDEESAKDNTIMTKEEDLEDYDMAHDDEDVESHIINNYQGEKEGAFDSSKVSESEKIEALKEECDDIKRYMKQRKLSYDCLIQGSNAKEADSEVIELFRKLTPPAHAAADDDHGLFSSNKSSKLKRKKLLKSPITKRKEIKRLFENHNECESSDILQELIQPATKINRVSDLPWIEDLEKQDSIKDESKTETEMKESSNDEIRQQTLEDIHMVMKFL